MDIPAPYTRKVFQQYHKQLLATRSMAYQDHITRTMSEEEPDISPEAKRGMVVHRIARLVFTNMLAIGSDNPLIQAVQRELRKEFGDNLEFHYPPGSLDLVIYRREKGGAQQLSKNEQTDVTSRAWQITLKAVDNYMF